MLVRVPGVECLVGWPCQKPRPGQACSKAMPTQNAPCPQNPPAQPRSPPRRLGQGDERSGHAIEQHGTWKAEQPALAGGEYLPEGLAEHPDDQAPSDGGHPAQAGPGPFRPSQQPHPEADLDPDGGGRDGHGVVAPDRCHGVVEVLDPGRRGGRCRFDHLRGHAERHRRLTLEDAVEDPEEAEGDPQ